MKIIQIPFCYYPDLHGGTEVYVESLSQHLQRCGVSITMVAPGDSNSSFIHEGLAVRKFKVGPVIDLRDLYGEGDMEAAEEFGRILEEERPDLIHLHAFTPGVSLRVVKEAKRRNIPVLFTYHTPAVSCQRGTLMRWGEEICDGRLDQDLCTRCTLQGLGLPRGVAELMGRVPVSCSDFLAKNRLSGGVWTALRMRELIRTRHWTFHQLMSHVGHIVAVCEWAREVLIINGVPSEKITVSCQGIDYDLLDQTIVTSKPRMQTGDTLRLVFLGRFEPMKGIHILIQAIRMVPGLPLSLDLYGIVQGATNHSYLERLEELSDGDLRIHFRQAISRQEVIARLKNYDVLVAPSQSLETGPQVVLEAFAAGIPVLGSNLAGIAELVEHGANGLLVEPSHSSKAWSMLLRRLCKELTLVDQLRAGVRPPRRMEEVAKEMESLYFQWISLSASE